eukprot:15471381-Alexandrium_andersonii.AAC.1
MFRDWSEPRHLSAVVGAFVHRKERVMCQRSPSPNSAQFLAQKPEVDEDAVGYYRVSPSVARRWVA